MRATRFRLSSCQHVRWSGREDEEWQALKEHYRVRHERDQGSAVRYREWTDERGRRVGEWS